MTAAKSAIPSVDVGGMHRPVGALDAALALRPYAGPWSKRHAAHLLRRAGFGGTDAEIAQYAAMSPDAAASALVHFASTSQEPGPPQLPDPYALRRDGARQGLTGPRASDMQRRAFGKQIRKQENASVLALKSWWLDRMLTTPAPLQEKMTYYYHGHFTTAAIQKGVTPEMVYNQNQLFRTYALGNLRSLTMAVSQDPAMLLYLDNALNSQAKPNENYARELMELFTLGVDHYSEDDVREAARAWTGYRIDRRDGSSYFDQRLHDNGTKTFLGRTGNFGPQDIVNIIFAQPQCATFFANSLLNTFVYNDPEPALVDTVAALLRKNDFELQPVVSTLLRSNVFYSDRAYRALVKTPVEFVVGAYKTLEIPQTDNAAVRALNTMGQNLFYPPNVAGWPGGENWLTSQMLIARQNFASRLVNTRNADGSQWMTSAPNDAAKAADVLVSAILQGDASPSSHAQLVAYLDGAGTSAIPSLNNENRDERLRGAAYLTMAMPGYQLN